MTNFFKDDNTQPLAIVTLVCLVLLAACIVWFAMTAKPAQTIEEHDYYALTTEVVEIDRVNDVVTCEDSNGNLWEFYGCEDWQEGDCASLLMDTCGTETIYDDEVCGTTYAQWTLAQEG